LQPLEEFEYGQPVELDLSVAYYQGPSFNSPIFSYNGMSRKCVNNI